MNKVYSFALLSLVFALMVFSPLMAQQSHQHSEKCLAHHYYREALSSDPSFVANQAQLEMETEQFVAHYMAERLNGQQQKNSSVVKIIPVVFHVIHEGGAENISRAQIEDQLVMLNADYRRQNADTVNTPVPFKPLGADTEIEFRLATKDPNGNCTDGIVRVFSSLTNNARNNVKALSYWPSNKYLNIWVVRTIENTSGSSGIILGFAQFPGGSAATDGIVVRQDYVGSIGTAGSNNDAGRTLTHEAGHWFNLRHIWGDAVCGNDFVADTPTHEGPNQSNCPTFPHITCSNGPNGDMFTNYMDYTTGSCQNIFSLGQSARMLAALNSAVSGRNNLWSTTNLVATGTDGSPAATCVPIAAFYNNLNLVCEGTTINFSDASWNGPVTSWSWDFPGGTPSTSTAQNPSVQYNAPGTYNVTLTVSNSAGTDSYTAVASVTVVPAFGQYGIPYSEGFETVLFPGNEWYIQNGGGNTWTVNSSVGHTGSKSVFINNYTGNTANVSDVFITPTYNMSYITSQSMTFWLAFAHRSSTSTDQLKVWASTNCGQLWNVRYNKTGATLSTAGIVSSNFIPSSASQWRQETVAISGSTYANKPNVRFKFEYIQNTGNNIYIDDININGIVGLNDAWEQSLNFNVYPNPVKSRSYIEFSLTQRGDIRIDVIDVMGRVVNEIAESMLDAGEYRFELPAELATGVYTVRLMMDGQSATRRVVIQ